MTEFRSDQIRVLEEEPWESGNIRNSEQHNNISDDSESIENELRNEEPVTADNSNTEEHNIGESFIISFIYKTGHSGKYIQSLLSFSHAEFCVLCESST